MKTFMIVALLAAVAAASAQHHQGHHHQQHHDYYSHPKYTYSYGVTDKHTGDVKSAGETRDGHLTKGWYSLVQPDGIIRQVTYVAGGKLGFQAQVVNKGKALHPAHHGHHGHHGHHHGHGGGIGNGRGLGF